MSQKKLQKQCSDTNKEFKAVKTMRLNGKRVYEVRDKKGGTMRIILKTPISKLGRLMRDLLFIKTKRKNEPA